jgi:hypothetical protein
MTLFEMILGRQRYEKDVEKFRVFYFEFVSEKSMPVNSNNSLCPAFDAHKNIILYQKPSLKNSPTDKSNPDSVLIFLLSSLLFRSYFRGGCHRVAIGLG